jgi:hypothetical protein
MLVAPMMPPCWLRDGKALACPLLFGTVVYCAVLQWVPNVGDQATVNVRHK